VLSARAVESREMLDGSPDTRELLRARPNAAGRRLPTWKTAAAEARHRDVEGLGAVAVRLA
jgi:hypothetical protein